MLKRIILLIAIVSCLAISGCGSDDGGKGRKEELILYCGAGIRPPVAECVEAFGQKHGVKIMTDYAGSEILLSRIRLTGKGDLYMPGDKHYVQQAADEGMILSQRKVCYFVPTILVSKDNPHGIEGLDDLLKPGVRLGLGDSKACAIGRKTKKIFEKNNIAWSAVEKNLKVQSQTVNELGMQIQAGSLDAVIVWDAVAAYYTEHGKEVPIPVEDNVISTVDIGILKSSVDTEMAEKFVEFITSQEGQSIFKKHSYRIQMPE